MWLVAGLGNPGSKYERTRHNIGFRVVDELARKHGLPAWKAGGEISGDITAGAITTERGRERSADRTEPDDSHRPQGDGGRRSQRSEGRTERIVVVKPMKFMNLSGFAVQRALAFHHIEIENLIVVHDDIDLEHGIVRLKSGGGHGGHNGLRSIDEQLGGKRGYARLRMGVGRPPPPMDAAAWVLADFSAAQAASVDAMIAAGLEDIETTLALGITAAMNRHNSRSSLATS